MLQKSNHILSIYISASFIFSLLSINIFAQYTPNLQIVNKDSVINKTPLLSVTTTAGENMFIWAIDRYIKKSDFAFINYSTIKDNLKTGFVWDNDGFQTNNFDHPVHGSFAYNAARSGGMNYWQSIPYSFCGSLMWEYFLENEPPSLPDLLSTSIGGLIIGETTHRLAEGIIINQSNKFKKTGCELASFVINPSKSIMRLVNEKNIKSRKYKAGSEIPISINAGVGFNSFFKHNKIDFQNSFFPKFYFDIGYNDPFRQKKFKPFDFFNMELSMNIGNGQPLLNKLNITGIIYGKKYTISKSGNLILGIYQHYDYYDSDSLSNNINELPYKLACPASYGPGAKYEIKNSISTRKISFEMHCNYNLIASAYTNNYNFNKRNYNFGSGINGKFYVHLADLKIGNLDLGVKYFKLYTGSGDPNDFDFEDEFEIEGDEGEIENIILDSKLNLFLTSNISFMTELEYFFRDIDSAYNTNYRYSIFDLNLSLIYKF